MINYLTVGPSILSALAEDDKVNVPILARLNFAGAISGSPFSGVSSHLILGEVPRIAGADMVIYPAPYGKCSFLDATMNGISLREKSQTTPELKAALDLWGIYGEDEKDLSKMKKG